MQEFLFFMLVIFGVGLGAALVMLYLMISGKLRL